MQDFITIKEQKESEIVEKKSRFITNIFYVENVKQAEDFIKQIRKKYFDAKHNCIAYRIMENNQLIEKSSDDGEPAGTAGSPMLSILQKNNICNVLVIVTRYFGGILLGTGGLVRAYSESVIKVLEESKKLKMQIGVEMEVVLDYNNFDSFKYYCNKNDISIIDVQYLELIVCRIELEEDTKERLMKDFKVKNINVREIKIICEKYVTKSIVK